MSSASDGGYLQIQDFSGLSGRETFDVAQNDCFTFESGEPA
jgi:hypothetical protein